MRRFVSASVAALLIVLVALPVSAASTTWKLYSFNASGYHLRAQVADVAPSGAVSFTFPTDTFTGAAYLTTAKVGTGANPLSAMVSITAAAGTTFANYPGCTNTTTNPTVGLYFETQSPGAFNPSAYWWSSQRVSLSSLVGNPPTLLSTSISSPSGWTNYNGQTDAAGFAAAAANITAWGVSFGGDCFYANGVAASNGSAVFTLKP